MPATTYSCSGCRLSLESPDGADVYTSFAQDFDKFLFAIVLKSVDILIVQRKLRI